MSEKRTELEILLDSGAGDCDDWCGGLKDPCFKCRVKVLAHGLESQLTEAHAQNKAMLKVVEAAEDEISEGNYPLTT